MVMVSVMQYLAGIMPPLQKPHNVHGIHYATCTRDTIKKNITAGKSWYMVNVLKFQKFSKEMWLSGLEFTKCM